mgnify:CR=1 FL=1|jgi:hypothetical protein
MTDKEKLLEAARSAGIVVDNYTITRVYDYNQARVFLNNIDSSIHLGMDMASLTCSGDVKIMPIGNNEIRLVANDNGSDNDFKFGGMLLLNSEIDDPNSSPELFIESAYDEEWYQKYAQDAFKYLDFDDGRYLILKDLNNGDYIYKKEDVQQYFDLEEEAYYYGEVEPPQCRRITKNTFREMLVYVNVQQCLRRHQGDMILFKGKNCTCDELANVFSERYKII